MRSPHVLLEYTVQCDAALVPSEAPSFFTTLARRTLQQVNLAGWYEISLVLTTDARMQRINAQHRGINKPTDVLSFPLSATPLLDLPVAQRWSDHPRGDDTHSAPLPPAHDLQESGDSQATHLPHQPIWGEPDAPYHLGDIIISGPTVMRQATAAAHRYEWEFAFLLVHGVLHLVGYDDYYEPGYQAMVRLQKSVLAELALTPYD